MTVEEIAARIRADLADADEWERERRGYPYIYGRFSERMRILAVDIEHAE